MAKSKLMLFLMLISIGLVNSAIAHDFTSWEKSKTYIEKINSNEFCEERWDVLWHWAKNGNLEARFMILFLLNPPPDMGSMKLPGRSGDVVSNIQDLVIFSVHSHEYSGDFPMRDEYKKVAYELYKMVGFEDSVRGKDFLECVQDAESSECADIAVSNKLVPSFNDYVLQIDALIKQGMGVECSILPRKIE